MIGEAVRHAVVARDQLRALNERMTDGYGDWHYLAERFMRALTGDNAVRFVQELDARINAASARSACATLRWFFLLVMIEPR